MQDFELSCPPPDPHPRSALFRPHSGSCDSHAHIIGPQAVYPFVADRSYTPPDALLPAYLKMIRTLRLSRAVLVQPSMHGTDNRVMLDAVNSINNQLDLEARAVVVVEPDISESEIERLHHAGARGVRLNLIYRGGGVGLAQAGILAQKIKPFGWHLQLLADVSQWTTEPAQLRSLPVPLVIDHMGHLPARAGAAHPGFLQLIELVREGNMWVKLSGAYRMSEGDLPYDDVKPFAKALINAAPNRMVWGSDWPHTVCRPAMPNDGDLLDLLRYWAGSDHVMHQILVSNPEALYGFENISAS